MTKAIGRAAVAKASPPSPAVSVAAIKLAAAGEVKCGHCGAIFPEAKRIWCPHCSSYYCPKCGKKLEQ
jgi:hypothetical protein